MHRVLIVSVMAAFLVGCSGSGNSFKVDDGGNLIEKDISMGKACAKKTECDDGHACTTDECAGGHCSNVLQPTYCLIKGVCVSEGALSPSNRCMKCETKTRKTTWTPNPASGCVVTLAGSGGKGYRDGQAGQALMYTPTGITLDSQGKIYFTEMNRCRIRTIWQNKVKTLAGDGGRAFKDGAAGAAKFYDPYDLAVDGQGVVYVADSGNSRIRKIANGQVTTLAGTGSKAHKDGPAGEARIGYPNAIVLRGGEVIFADSSNGRIKSIKGGQVKTIAGTGEDKQTDGPALQAAFSGLRSLASQGDKLYILDSGKVRLLSGGQVTTLGGRSGGYQDGPLDQAKFNDPYDIAVDKAGAIYVADTRNHLIRKIQNGQVTTVAGVGPSAGSAGDFEDGPAKEARFSYPVGVVVGSDGKIYITDQDNYRIRVYIP